MVTKILVSLLLLGSGFALFSADSAVFKLTESNFKSTVLDSDEFWLVEFYGKNTTNFSSMVRTL